MPPVGGRRPEAALSQQRHVAGDHGQRRAQLVCGHVQEVTLDPRRGPRLRIEPAVAQRKRGQVADQLHCRHLVLAEHDVPAPAQHDDGDHLAAQHQWHCQRVADAGERPLQLGRQDAAVVGAADHRPLARQRLCHQGLHSDRLPEPDHVGEPQHVARVLDHGLLAVDAHERRALRRHRLQQPVEHPAHDLPLVEGGRDVRGQLDRRLQAARGLAHGVQERRPLQRQADQAGEAVDQCPLARCERPCAPAVEADRAQGGAPVGQPLGGDHRHQAHASDVTADQEVAVDGLLLGVRGFDRALGCHRTLDEAAGQRQVAAEQGRGPGPGGAGDVDHPRAPGLDQRDHAVGVADQPAALGGQHARHLVQPLLGLQLVAGGAQRVPEDGAQHPVDVRLPGARPGARLALPGRHLARDHGPAAPRAPEREACR